MIMFCVKQACLGGVLLFGVLLMMCSGGGSRPAAVNRSSYYQSGNDAKAYLFASMKNPRPWNREVGASGNRPIGKMKEHPRSDSSLAVRPEHYQMDQNEPNPFYPDTRITVRVPETGQVNLTVLDPLGREVCALVDQELQPGAYEISWDGRDLHGRPLPGGTYLYRLVTERIHITRKMQLLHQAR